MEKVIKPFLRAVIHKCQKHETVVKIPRSGWLTKIALRAKLIQEVTKDPQTLNTQRTADLTFLS